MPVRASRRPSRAPAFPFPPPGPPGDLGLSRDLGLPVASPWAQRLLQAASSRGRESGERLPGSRGGPCVPGQGSAEPSPSRRPARFRSPSGPSRTHEAAARPFPLPIRSPRARAAFRVPVWPLPLPVGPSRAHFFAVLRPWCACAVFPAARTRRSACPSRGGLGSGQETPPSCPEGSSRPLPGLPTKDGCAPRLAPVPGDGSRRDPCAPFVPVCGGGDGQGGSCLAVP